jgi:hypothetical protein
MQHAHLAVRHRQCLDCSREGISIRLAELARLILSEEVVAVQMIRQVSQSIFPQNTNQNKGKDEN